MTQKGEQVFVLLAEQHKTEHLHCEELYFLKCVSKARNKTDAIQTLLQEGL